jgi:hypothetical protein
VFDIRPEHFFISMKNEVKFYQFNDITKENDTYLRREREPLVGRNPDLEISPVEL